LASDTPAARFITPTHRTHTLWCARDGRKQIANAALRQNANRFEAGKQLQGQVSTATFLERSFLKIVPNANLA